MRFTLTSSIVAVATMVPVACAATRGFNYGGFFGDQTAKFQKDFEYEFDAAKQLPGTNGEFTNARLYSMLQWATVSTPIEAIPAAISTNTRLLLGLWASAGATQVTNEITALTAAIVQYGTAFTDLVDAISVGSEDLYRSSDVGIQNGNTLPGATPNELAAYIQQLRAALQGTALQGKPIGHVDTWTVYVNISNKPLIDAVDFVGVDAYPYFQGADIGIANQTFYDAYKATVDNAQGKPVWVTETGWPVSGKLLNQAAASPENARLYWEDVVCSLIEKDIPVYYYMLQDAQLSEVDPSFGIKPAGDLMQMSALFDLSCPAISSPTSSQTLSGSSTNTPTVNIPTTDIPTTSIPSGTSTDTEILSTTPLSAPITNTVPWLATTLATIFSTMSVSFPVGPSDPTVTIEPTATMSIPIPGPVPTQSLPQGPTPQNAPSSTPLTGPIEAPHLIVPVDKSRPDTSVRNQYIAKLSSTQSTVYSFDIPPSSDGKTCNLVFNIPNTPFEWWTPYKMTSPGGISVSQLDNPVTQDTTFNSASSGKVLGNVAQLIPGQQQVIGGAPCAAGQRVGYRADAINGLDLEYFQLSEPALGLSVVVSDKL